MSSYLELGLTTVNRRYRLHADVNWLFSFWAVIVLLDWAKNESPELEINCQQQYQILSLVNCLTFSSAQIYNFPHTLLPLVNPFSEWRSFSSTLQTVSRLWGISTARRKLWATPEHSSVFQNRIPKWWKFRIKCRNVIRALKSSLHSPLWTASLEFSLLILHLQFPPPTPPASTLQIHFPSNDHKPSVHETLTAEAWNDNAREEWKMRNSCSDLNSYS